MVASMTVADFKKTMGITDKSVITCLKLGAWNGGKIESITVSAKGEAPKVEGAEEIVLEAPKDLEGDYLYLLTEPTTIGIYPNDYCLGANPGITIYLTIEMESNGPFGGGIGICVNEWLWYQKEYSSDDQNKCTLELFITPLQNCFQFQVWWMGGTQLGIKSITVEKAVDYRVPAAQQEPVRDPYAGNANASHHGFMDFADARWWTEREISLAELIGDVDPATITSIVFNGETDFKLSYNDASGWTYKDPSVTHTVTDIFLNSTGYCVALGLSKGNNVMYRFTWDVYTNGATPAVDPSTGGTDQNVRTASYTFSKDLNNQHESYTYDLNSLFPDAVVGDTVDVTVELTSNGGWFGGCIGYNDASGWQSLQIDTLNTTYTVTVPVLYASGTTGQIQQWWIGGADVTANITFKLN